MSSNSGVNATVRLPFPAAGVSFNIRVASPDIEGPSTFTLTAHRWAAGEDAPSTSAIGATTDEYGQDAIPFSVDASPCLADWVRGYTRWLVRAGVRATHDSYGITGAFAESMTAEQALLGLRSACDMIRQRFELYEESVVVN